MPLPPLGYATDWTVRTFEIDTAKRMTVPALVQAMQEAAMQNVLRIRLSVWDLEPHRISWVLMKFKLDLYRLPSLGESLRIRTYPAGFEKFFTYRDYLVEDNQGQLLARASSQWLLMDTDTRRMTRIPAWILALEESMTNRADWLERPDRRLVDVEEASNTRTYKVDYFDLDFNGHLNNLLYFRWMLETLPAERLTEGRLQRMEVHFRAEAKWNEVLGSTVQAVDERTYAHRLARDGQALATGLTTFAE